MTGEAPRRGDPPVGATAAPATGARAEVLGSDPLLAHLWERYRQTNLDRIVALERAASAARAGALGGDLRAEAERAAHALSGALGTFGFADATGLALDAEALLGESAVDGGRLAAVVARMRREVTSGRPGQPRSGEPAR